MKSIFRKEGSPVKTAEERVASLHVKMERRKRLREQRRTGLIGGSCVVLSLCLAVCIFAGGTHNGGTAGMYSGATMLFEGSGGYVLVAVIAFMAGAAVAMLLIRQKGKLTQQGENEENEKKSGSEDGFDGGDQK
jgi:hypothetical protein